MTKLQYMKSKGEEYRMNYDVWYSLVKLDVVLKLKL